MYQKLVVYTENTQKVMDSRSDDQLAFMINFHSNTLRIDVPVMLYFISAANTASNFTKINVLIISYSFSISLSLTQSLTLSSLITEKKRNITKLCNNLSITAINKRRKAKHQKLLNSSEYSQTGNLQIGNILMINSNVIQHYI
jgi:hypothetical protein